MDTEFKIYSGPEANLPTDIHEGYAYLTEDSYKLYVDISPSRRICLNAKIADNLASNLGDLSALVSLTNSLGDGPYTLKFTEEPETLSDLQIGDGLTSSDDKILSVSIPVKGIMTLEEYTSLQNHKGFYIVTDGDNKTKFMIDGSERVIELPSEIVDTIARESIENLNQIKANKVDIVDNLTTADSEKILSANQGKVLKDNIDALNSYIKVISMPKMLTSTEVNVGSGNTLLSAELGGLFFNSATNTYTLPISVVYLQATNEEIQKIFITGLTLNGTDENTTFSDQITGYSQISQFSPELFIQGYNEDGVFKVDGFQINLENVSVGEIINLRIFVSYQGT